MLGKFTADTHDKTHAKWEPETLRSTPINGFKYGNNTRGFDF